MEVNNPRQETNCQLLVRVSDNVLCLNDDVWQNLKAACMGSRVIVLSVIGQPKSKKTTLLNRIICSFRGDDGNISVKHRFPLDYGDDDIQSNNDGGILVNKCSTRNSTFVLLDIWSANLTKDTYNKLVDLCLVMSSIVIYAESWEQETSKVYWLPELSTFIYFDRSLFSNLQELHFLIETDKYFDTNRLYLPGQPSTHHWDYSPALTHNISFNTFWDNFTNYVTTSYIPSAQMSLSNEASLMSSALTKIIFNCLDTPVRVDVEHIRIAEFLKFINGQPSTLQCDTVVNDNCSDIEMKRLSFDDNAQDDDPSTGNKTSSSENYSNVSIDGHCDTVADVIEPSRSELMRKCYDCVNFCIGHNVFGDNRLDEIISQNFPNHSPLKSEVEKHVKLWLVVLRRYDFYMTNKLQTEICVDDCEFEKLHRESLNNAKQVEGWNEDEDVYIMIEKLVAQQKISFSNTNESIYKKEKQISALAQQMAVAQFQSLLKKTLLVSTFSENEFSATYDKAVESASQLFFQALGPNTTKPWFVEYERLKETLSSMRTDYAKQNGNRLSKIDEIRLDAIIVAKHCYEKEMENQLPAAMLATDKLESISKTCSEAARRLFHQKIGKNINKNVVVTWEKELNQSIDETKSIFLAKNDKLPPQPKPTIQIDRSKNTIQLQAGPISIAQNEELLSSPKPIVPLPTGIGVYIDQHIVIVSPFGMAPFEVDHNIAIDNNGVISLGTEASRTYGAYHQHTLFQLLTGRHTWVEGRGKPMEMEENLSLYFHSIRMLIEQRVKKRVSSCYVTITGLLTSKAKQMLKTSLTIAGFDRNTLIPSTTAMAILYWHRLDEPQRKFHRNLFIHISYDIVELALTDVSDDWINVLHMCGNYKQGDFGVKYLNNALRDPYCTNVVVWTANDSPFNVKRDVKNFFGNTFDTMTHMNFNTSDVIKVAAMLDSNRSSSSPLHRIPEYNCVHPYRIYVHRIKNGKLKPRVELPRDGGSIVVKSKSEHDFVVRFEEQATVQDTSPFTVEEFDLQWNNEARVSLGIEGNLLASPKMKRDEERAVFMKPTIDRKTDCCRRQWEALERPFNNVPSSNSSPHERCLTGYTHAEPSIGSSGKYERRLSHGASEKLSEDMKKSVTLLIEKTRFQLSSSQLTPEAHRVIIESKISKCETLMNSPNVKVKQLEIDKSLLERAAQLIK